MSGDCGRMTFEEVRAAYARAEDRRVVLEGEVVRLKANSLRWCDTATDVRRELRDAKKHLEGIDRSLKIPTDGAAGSETVRQVRARLFMLDAFRAGHRCPCCSRWVRLQPRRLRPELAGLVLWMFREGKGAAPYMHINAKAPRWGLRGKDYSILAHWGIIKKSKRAEHADPKKRYSGWWRLTDKGLAFARGEIRVPTHVLTYEAKSYGFEGDPTTIFEALAGAKFDYSELGLGKPEGGE